MRPGRAPSHVLALDGLRGLAILLVIPHNMNFGAQGIVRVATFAAGAGWIGVQLFFVLSGYLITCNLLDTLQSDNYYRVFFARRILRIVPLYVAFLAFALLVLPAAGIQAVQYLHNRSDQVWIWIFLVNWAMPFGHNVPGFGHFWSLGVEEQFYAIWPFVVARCSRRLAATCVVIAVVGLVVRATLLAVGAPALAAYTFTVCRVDALALGAAVAAMVRKPVFSLPARWPAGRLVLAATALLVGGGVITRGYPAYGAMSLTLGQSLLALAFALVILAIVTGGAGWWRTMLESAPLRSAGKYSYGMYVLHPLIDTLWQPTLLAACRWTGAWLPVVYMGLTAAMSFGAAFLSYHLLEKHFLRMKQLFVPSERQPTQGGRRPLSSPVEYVG